MIYKDNSFEFDLFYKVLVLLFLFE